VAMVAPAVVMAVEVFIVAGLRVTGIRRGNPQEPKETNPDEW